MRAPEVLFMGMVDERDGCWAWLGATVNAEVRALRDEQLTSAVDLFGRMVRVGQSVSA